MELQEIVNDFSFALKQVDSTRPIEKNFQPGIGPHGEDNARDLALEYLQKSDRKEKYKDAGPKNYSDSRQECDLVIPNEWAIELKLMRPFGNNDLEAENWSSKIIHPYYGNKSLVGDALKLIQSSFTVRKAVMLLLYEHNEPRLDKEATLKTLELILTNLYMINVGVRIIATAKNLVHPTHQVLHVIAWEIKK